MAETDPMLVIPFSWTQQNKEKLSAAQLIVAMAALISKRLDGTISQDDAYTIARISSPTNWEYLGNPYSLLPTTPLVTPLALAVSLNDIIPDIDASKDSSMFPQPFCDNISVHIDARGPVKHLSVLLDDKVITSFEGAGSFNTSIDTTNYTDALHHLIVTVSPSVENVKPLTRSVSFSIFNGHAGDFTPAESSSTTNHS
jgi:hypothetical protein